MWMSSSDSSLKGLLGYSFKMEIAHILIPNCFIETILFMVCNDTFGHVIHELHFKLMMIEFLIRNISLSCVSFTLWSLYTMGKYMFITVHVNLSLPETRPQPIVTLPIIVHHCFRSLKSFGYCCVLNNDIHHKLFIHLF